MQFRHFTLVVAAAVLIVSSEGCRRVGREASSEESGDAVQSAKAVGEHSKVAVPQPAKYSGSKTCQDCHEDFYKLWATSYHGLAMRPYTTEFGRKNLTPQTGGTVIGKNRYRAEIDDRGGRIRQIGPDGERTFPIAQVMGGKNVFYFLTPMERGRLQVLPLAYDVHKKAWYDTAGSGVRHFTDRRDEALDWTDRMFTFNTTCFNCHVSQLRTNYDLAHDTYHTTWSEPGISCESCHGPGKRARRRDDARRRRQRDEGHQDHSHQGLHRPSK